MQEKSPRALVSSRIIQLYYDMNHSITFQGIVLTVYFGASLYLVDKHFSYPLDKVRTVTQISRRSRTDCKSLLYNSIVNLDDEQRSGETEAWTAKAVISSKHFDVHDIIYHVMTGSLIKQAVKNPLASVV